MIEKQNKFIENDHVMSLFQIILEPNTHPTGNYI